MKEEQEEEGDNYRSDYLALLRAESVNVPYL